MFVYRMIKIHIQMITSLSLKTKQNIYFTLIMKLDYIQYSEVFSLKTILLWNDKANPNYNLITFFKKALKMLNA